MDREKLELVLLPDRLAICSLPRDEAIPEWGCSGSFFAVVRTEEELSVVCPDGHPPPAVEMDAGWRALKVQGPLALTETGILAGLTAPLAAAGIPVFAVCTYRTDYLLVKEEQISRAVRVLSPTCSIHT